MKALLFALATLCLAGCSSVVMEAPFPDAELSPEEMTALRGTWQLEDSVVYVNFTTNGVLNMVSVESDDGQFSLINHNAHIARQGDRLFISLQADPEDELQGHFFAAIKTRNNRELLVWGPDVTFFEEQVATEQLKGTVKKDEHSSEVRLTSPPEKILTLAASNPDAIDFEEPLIFKKID